MGGGGRCNRRLIIDYSFCLQVDGSTLTGLRGGEWGGGGELISGSFWGSN